MLPIGIGGNTLPGYYLESSLRFRSSASPYLSRTPASAGNRKTWTWSGWVKRGKLGAYQNIFFGSTGDYNTNDVVTFFRFDSADTISFFDVTAGVANNFYYSASSRVFRDTSAWYHFVVKVDTTQTTASDRLKIYVNGEEITSWSSTVNPTLNDQTGVNSSTGNHRIGFYTGINTQYFDGYMTEVNFVDGQALTPSDFGETDTTTGVWKPKQYAGTYGTNGFYLPFTEKTDFKSFDLDGTGDYISAPASEYSNYINGSGDFTIEWWANYDALPSDAGWYAQDSGSAVVSPFNLFQQTNNWRLYATTANGAWNVFSNTLLATTSLTTGRWYHIACVRNGSTLTLYVDGVSQGTANIGTASLWTDTSHNLSLFNDWQSAGGGGGFNGRVSNYRLVKGTAVYTGNFTPPTANLENISGTTILLARSTSTADLSGNITTTANGNLSLSDNNPPLSSGIGDDTSGNDNHWASNNIDLTSNATTYDVMNDVPTLTDEDTANFPILNINLRDFTYLGLINAGLQTVAGGANVWQTIAATMAVPTSGKYYWETKFEALSGSNPYAMIGILPTYYSAVGSNTYTGSATLANGFSYYLQNGYIYNNGAATAYGSTATVGDVIGVAVDADNGKLWFSKNGVWQNSGDPTNGNDTNDATSVTGQTYDTTKEYYPTVSNYNSSQVSINFGQQPFKYTPPTGYKKLNTYNLPDSTIKDGSQYFITNTFTGTGSTLSIDTGFSPDFVWLKSRSFADHPLVYDSIRGANQRLYSSLTNAESTANNQLNSFDSDGYTLGSDPSGQINVSGQTSVGWSWRGSDSSPVSNTDGTITSTVSANPTSGFSIVTWTGDGGSNQSVGHGLSEQPDMVIVKKRNKAENWYVASTSSGYDTNFGYHLHLNTTGAVEGINDPYYLNSIGSVVDKLLLSNGSSNNGGNENGINYVAYCWHSVEGFSKIGSYTGNGSTDGPFVYTGFRPAFVMVKNTSTSATNWCIHDTSRETYNISDSMLLPNDSAAEVVSGTAYGIDILSNGFKIKNSNSNFNTSGNNYIYMAFAENPFKQSLAR